MRSKGFILFFSFFIFSGVSAQTVWHLKLKKYKVAVLDSVLNETSGLTFHQGKLFTLNDGGNSPQVFEINPKNGEIVNSITIDATNTDWESLSSDGENMYIADIGNNLGDRKDLAILKTDIKISSKIQKLNVYYPNQKDFKQRNFKHNLDSEATVYLQDGLRLFSKEWQSKKVTNYKISEDGALQISEKYNCRFMVTGAEYFSGFLYLVGYTKKAEVFMLRFRETSPGVFFTAKPRLFFLGMAFSVGQIEAIAADENGLYLTSEKFYTKLSKVPPTLYFVPFKKLK